MTYEHEANNDNLNELMALRRRVVQLERQLSELELLDAERRKMAETLTSLLLLSQMVVGARDIQPVLDQAVKSAVEIAATADSGSIQLLDKSGDLLRTVAASGVGLEISETIAFQPGVGVAGHALVSGQIINVSDVLEDKRFVPSNLPLRFRSLLVAPLVVKGERLGTLSLSSAQVAAFSSGDEDLIQLIADQTAVALENAQLFRQRREAELALQAHRDQLEDLVKERTSELVQTNERLELEIVERKRAEEALAESEKRYRAVVEDQTELICRFLPDGTLTFVNQAYCRYVGKKRDEILGRKVIPLFAEADPSVLQQRVASLTAEKPVQTHEHSVVTNGDEIRWQQWTDRAIFDEQSKLVEFQSVGRDITERKRLEEQLLQSQKMEAIGRLAGGIAHDFNNLLTVILAYSDMLLHELEEDDPLHLDMEEINRAGERAAALTRQLLAFSRKQMLQPEILDLNQILTLMEGMLRRLIGEDIALDISLTDDIGAVKADPGQIEQVLLNLVVNARDAMPHGGMLVIKTDNITLTEEDTQHIELEPGQYVILSITDSGQGMDAETQTHIFEPFFTTKAPGVGTGLGLATVFGIVKQSDGHIDLNSEVGLGTTFKIYLPHLSDTPTKVIQQTTRSAIPRGTETVLLVEDEDDVRQLVQMILTEQGYSVLVAGYGQQALEVCDQFDDPIDLLLTDVIMPGGMNGRDLADRLKPRYPDMRVLYMSGYTENTIIHHGVLDESLELLQKPFTLDVLARRVRAVLDADADADADI